MTLKPCAFVLFNVGQQPESTTKCDNTHELIVNQQKEDESFVL
jgi:hypothetical protein